ncbi:hypothetical protein NLI96_g447 [Meripilus lineatus]|uniref:Uncharacterized protein n=1 Tax=Meripilus lineatus TaxID=2056292 RepID=A0AAD5YIG2_9APHY|nr:hypothetical protein NLI96_g447 [Physisporinus lineatus]
MHALHNSDPCRIMRHKLETSSRDPSTSPKGTTSSSQRKRSHSDGYRRFALSNGQRCPHTPVTPPTPTTTMDKYQKRMVTCEASPAAFILAVDPEWRPNRGEATLYIFPQDHGQGDCDRISMEEILAGFYPDSDINCPEN